MIDLHTHVLPGMDDGAADVNEAIQMLKDSYAQGVTLCAATPHCKLRSEESITEFLNKRDEAYRSLCEAMDCNDVPEIVLGAEVYVDNDISKYEDISRLCIEGTCFLLVELPHSASGAEYSEWLYNLNRRGIVPVVAHISRYDNYRELVSDFSGVELVYQINNSRTQDIKGRRFIKKLMTTGYMIIMASDMHNMDLRACDMKKSYEIMRKKMPEYADDLFTNNANLIINLARE